MVFHLIHIKMENNKTYSQVDEAELKRCKEDPHYFATTYMLVGDKPYVPILSKEEFNRQIRPTEKDINKWFIIRRGRRNGRG